MRVSAVLVPALAASAMAGERRPYMDILNELYAASKDLLNNAQSYIQNAPSYLRSAATGVADAGAAKVASTAVTRLTTDNWSDVLQHSGKIRPYNPPEAWMVYITGGNKTCRGRCDRADAAWNESVALFAADVSAPKLAVLDCETQEILCGAWAAQTPSIWFFLLGQPLPDQNAAPTPITIHNLNRTTVTNAEITKIHTRKLYLETPVYDGVLHPFDGIVARLGLTLPLAYALYAIGKVPSWAFMVGLSIVSRWFVAKRMPPPQSQRQQQPQPPQNPIPGDAR